ncbi:FAD-binding oxidoreductase [Pseudoroseicyclus aestuarii]|uniref:D-lactate dehydrogenase (cytochrome) n=1 Tax=Pseudoroseicyclus aestuarii TaxID=1795041 RepID=A0A318SNX2_9RHOB|nr:FAD-linked oxidase C-terminal domain-containing protein [Pseudoroseicyclus aestuarii]PYE82513.1 D-lactate dehydrogenase (cytochrome) [Pseudoroseicyclus aestuarii]
MTMDAALDAMAQLLGDRLSRSTPDRDAHGQSESWFAPMPPDAVAYPKTTEEVAGLARIAHAHGVPLVGWGAGTSLEGHALAARGGVCIDFSRMDRVLQINAEDMDVRVQPGVTRTRLNEELRATGLFFPVDPGADASLGGMAATRASGTTAVRYGTMRDAVLALEVVLADGRVIRTGSRARKTSAGYDLTALMVGSEGTLGLITELTLRLRGQPEAVSAAKVAFETIEGAVDAVMEVIQCGVPMARIEFVDAATVEAFNSQHDAGMPLHPHLLVEFHGSPTAVAEQAELFGAVAEEHGGEGFQWSDKAEDRSRLWEMRHRAYWSILASRPGTQALITDVTVPISRLAEAVRETQADIEASGIEGPILGHVGDGNFHAILLLRDGQEEDVAEAKALAHRMADRALRLGGTVTGEHGVGLGKLGYMEAELGEGWEVMGLLKQALDPKGILNPGKLLRQPEA